jgi:hypothetical protein
MVVAGAVIPRRLALRLPRRLALRRQRADGRRVSIGLWLPLTPILAILSPIALLLSPFALMWSRRRGVRPVRAVWALGALLMSLSGTLIEVDAPGARVRIRIF